MSQSVTIWRQALDVLVPVLLGGVSHVVVIKRDWAPQLAAIPIDGGLLVRGKRLFGANKTLRGVLAMTMATALWNVAYTALTSAEFSAWDSTGWGALLGLGYVLGELPNSAMKRQLDIKPGDPAVGALAPFLWFVDQLDSLAGVAILAALVDPIPAMVLGLLCGLTLIVHPAVAWIMVLLGLKKRVG